MNHEFSDRDELLQRFLDGDLSPSEAEQARSLMASDPEFRLEAESYRRLGDLVRELSHGEACEQEANVIWDRINGRVKNPPSDDIAEPSPAFVWFSEFVAHRKRYWVPFSGLGAAAAAAAIVLALHAPVSDVSLPVPDPSELGSRVTSISLNSASTLVLEVETGAGGTAAVLWVTGDDEDESGGGDGSQPSPEDEP
jgi:anti-sigma factor RsiW